MRVEARLTEADPARLRIGMPMELVLIPAPGAGGALTYAFRPAEDSVSVAVVGVGIHPFGRHEGVSGLEMAAVAARAALRDAGVGWQDVEFAAGGSDAAGNADTTVSVLGLTGVPFINVRNGCATGGSALATAHAMLAAGAAEIALVVGFDKHPPGAFNPLPEDWGLGSWYGETGLMLTTQFFAMKIQRYMAEHGISASTLAKVAAKAFANGARNPNAWRRRPLSEDEVLASKMVNHPLTQYMFCSPGEGAVALVLARGERARTLARAPVYLRSVAFRTRRFGSFEVFSPSIPITAAPSPTTEAAAAAFEQAGIGPEDVDVAQLQDTESGAEIMHLAETGLCEHGEQESLIQSGATRAATAGCPSTPTAAAWPTASRSARPACARSTRSCSSSAARRASARSPGRRASASPRSTARRESARAPCSAAERPRGPARVVSRAASRGRATSASSRFRYASPGPARSWSATPGRRWTPGCGCGLPSTRAGRLLRRVRPAVGRWTGS